MTHKEKERERVKGKKQAQAPAINVTVFITAVMGCLVEWLLQIHPKAAGIFAEVIE